MESLVNPLDIVDSLRVALKETQLAVPYNNISKLLQWEGDVPPAIWGGNCFQSVRDLGRRLSALGFQYKIWSSAFSVHVAVLCWHPEFPQDRYLLDPMRLHLDPILVRTLPESFSGSRRDFGAYPLVDGRPSRRISAYNNYGWTHVVFNPSTGDEDSFSSYALNDSLPEMTIEVVGTETDAFLFQFLLENGDLIKLRYGFQDRFLRIYRAGLTREPLPFDAVKDRLGMPHQAFMEKIQQALGVYEHLRADIRSKKKR